VDGSIYLTSFDGDQRTLHCLDVTSGETRWQRSVTKLRDENASPPNNPATSTPASNGNRIVAFYPDAGLCCYSSSGEAMWRAEVGPFHSMHGVAHSPIIGDGLVFLLADQLRGSYLAAYDLETGDRVWKVDRLDGLTGGYSTPVLITTAGERPLLVVSGPHELIGYDPESGDVVWSVPGVTNAPVSLPLAWKDRLFICEPVGELMPISMLKPMDTNGDGNISLDEAKGSLAMSRLLSRIDENWGDDDGIVTPAEWDEAFGGFIGKAGLVSVQMLDVEGKLAGKVRWTYGKTVPYVSSPVLYEDILYFVQDGGIVTALDPEDGRVLKRDRLRKGGSQFYASPVAADGKLFLVDRQGQVTVLEAGADWKVLATNDLGEACFASPAIYGNSVLLRTDRSLFCFGIVADSD
jgi:outer membrane protein assembly factor BamB